MKERFLRIGEVAKLTGLSKSTIRRWEREFPMLKPLKRKGYRLYTPEDVKLILAIKELYDRGFTREGIIRQISPELTEEEMGFLSILRGIKAEIEEIMREIDADTGCGDKEEL